MQYCIHLFCGFLTFCPKSGFLTLIWNYFKRSATLTTFGILGLNSSHFLIWGGYSHPIAPMLNRHWQGWELVYIVVTVCQTVRGRRFKSQPGRKSLSRLLFPLPTQSLCMSALNAWWQPSGDGTVEGSILVITHQPLYAESKKMKSQAIDTHACPCSASLSNCKKWSDSRTCNWV